MKKIILAYGEFLWDILPQHTLLGGAPFNFTCRVHSLGHHALIASRLGSDELGRKALDKVKALNLDTSCLQIDPDHPTGFVPISFDHDQNPIFHITPNVAFDHIQLTESLKQTAVNADCICFGTLCQRCNRSRSTLQKILELSKASLKVFDINLRKDCYTIDTIEFSLAHANLLKCNEDEAHRLADMFNLNDAPLPDLSRRFLEKWSLEYCLVTLGPYGALAVSKSGTYNYDPGYKIQPKDTVGAGDAFTAGFVHQILEDAPLDQALALANTLGAIVAQQTGATQPVTPDQIQHFTDQKHPRFCHPNILP
ncbi:MAG: hypothetical protein IID32_05600 [Planctomycetes bacterium]|nr:hypothetical protein [Planctomycetota bacterium]